MDFQQDVKRALADHFGEFVTASESVTESGLHVMRVVTTGKISELSIEWVYFHLTDNQGRRASCVYTYESDLADRFGASDQSLVSSFQFVEKTAGKSRCALGLPQIASEAVARSRSSTRPASLPFRSAVGLARNVRKTPTSGVRTKSSDRANA